MDEAAPFFDDMVETWPDRDVARAYLAAVHRKDIERASVTPVIHVTVPGLPGLFSGAARERGITYAPEMTGGFAVIGEGPPA